jgi:hypothetical protein
MRDAECGKRTVTANVDGFRILSPFSVALCFCGSLAIILRLLFLNSDPYPGLDWSSGLLTDESFYSHNARNLALFGRARMDEFNNMLLSPLLHFAQWRVFATFGVGFLEARTMAAAASILSLGLFYAALNRAFGLRVALAGSLFYCFDHAYLLYSRMALLDSYAVLPCVAAFYFFVRGTQSDERAKTLWLFGCGILLAAAVTNRSLCLYLAPVPAIALFRRDIRSIIAPYVGLAAVIAIYAVFWYFPHRSEIAHMTHYYRTVQLQPKSVGHFLATLYHNLLGDRRGIFPYLFRHTPIVFGLTLAGLALWRRRESASESEDGLDENARAAERYLTAWLLLGWALIFVLGYSPSRYYVTTYPALYALAGLFLTRIPQIAQTALLQRNRFLLSALVWLLAYHLIESVLHRGGLLNRPLTMIALHGVPTLAAIYAYTRRHKTAESMTGRNLAAWVIGLWALINIGWLAHWGITMRWSQQEFTAWMTRNLPANSVVIGDVAAGLELGLPFQTVNVIPGLCNYRAPLEGYGAAPRYIVILDGPWTKGYWQGHYWQYVAPHRAIHRGRALKWDMAIYPVSEDADSSSSTGRDGT